MFLKSKLGIIPLVSLSFLMVASVIIYFLLYSWFSVYISGNQVFVEKNNFERDFEIVKIAGDFIYLQNDYESGVQVGRIKFDSQTCTLSSNSSLTLGLNMVNVSECSAEISDNVIQEVSIITNVGVKREYEAINYSEFS